MTKTIPIGTRVTVKNTTPRGPERGSVGVVIPHDPKFGSGIGTILVEIEGWDGGHDGLAYYNGRIRNRWFASPYDLDVTPKETADRPSPEVTSTPMVRQFDTGATRDLDENKLDFEGFLSPRVTLHFAQYMHGKRKMADGSLRDADNWQKGIPMDAYMKSMWRHFHDLWLHHRGLGHLAVEDLPTTLGGLKFNVDGYYHEHLVADETSTPA